MSSETSPSAPWRKSSYSTADETTTCVELADGRSNAHRLIAVRDSKHPDGPVLCFTPSEFRPFLDRLRDT